MHGNEVVGRELLLRLANYICDQYNNGNFLSKWLLEHTRIHILPTMNPDGFDVACANVSYFTLLHICLGLFFISLDIFSG